MEPMFHDGDELYVRKQPSVEIGEIGIFIKNGEGFVKEAGEGRLISLNPEFDDIYTNGEPIVCFGKVLGKVEKG
jgi:SOS-response transcriptional repressor LexA